MPFLQQVRERRDELEREASLVAYLDMGPQNLREVYVPEAGGEAIGVGEVDVVEEVPGREYGSGDRALLDVHVKGIGHDATVRKACLPPHPHALVEPVEHVGAVAVPALEREIDTEGSGVLTAFSYPSCAHRPSTSR